MKWLDSKDFMGTDTAPVTIRYKGDKFVEPVVSPASIT